MTKRGTTARKSYYNVTVKPNDNPMIDENPEVEAVEAEVEAVEEVSPEKEAEETV